MLLQKHVKVTATLLCKTGLHIGSSSAKMEIGTVDLPIIKHPLSDEPYIPGSSLKGKLRSLLETQQKNYKVVREPSTGPRKVQTETDPCGCGECLVCKVFGPHKNVLHNLGPTRLLVRDALLSQDSKDLFRRAVEGGGSPIEEKTENIINRKTGTAEHPRTQERIPAGSKFDFRASIRIFEGDKEEEIKTFLQKGLQLLQDDYLGGSGSRGYGEVELRDIKFT